MNIEDIPYLTKDYFEHNKDTISGWFCVFKDDLNDVNFSSNGYALFDQGEIIKKIEILSGGNFRLKIYLNRLLHCDPGPAFIVSNKIFSWTGSDFVIDESATLNDFYYYQYGKRHRIGGPSMVVNNKECYFIKGKQMSYEEYLQDPLMILFNHKTEVLNIIKNS